MVAAGRVSPTRVREPDRKTTALVALALMTACAALTCAVHFLQLTVVRRLPVDDPRFVAAPVFRGYGLAAAIRRGMKLSGGLCMTGVIAQATGNFWFQYPAILGYAFVFPAVCVLLSRHFRP
jgi:hypothetical protein